MCGKKGFLIPNAKIKVSGKQLHIWDFWANLAPKQGIMKLQKGDDALDFTVLDMYGKETQLSSFKGRKIVLSFYRNAGCPFCNRRVHQLISRKSRLLTSDTQLIFLFESSNKKLQESAFLQEVSPYPLIGNSDRSIFAQYHVEKSLLGVLKTPFMSSFFKALRDTRPLNLPADKEASSSQMPADFFIDENFTIVRAHYGAHMDDHVSLEDLMAFAGVS
jgi:peroxiredoxin